MLIQAAQGEPAAFGALFDRHFATLYRFCERRVGRHLAEDLAGETFRRAFETRGSYDLSQPTTDELGRRTVSVATVLQPAAKVPPPGPRLVSYQAAYDALGAQCDPSYTLRLGASTAAPVLPYLAAGDTVVISDFEGEDLAFGAGQQSGYEALDAIRAVETWLGVAEASTPVGMAGYSGGSVPTEFASELAATYAPHLDIVGVAEGGTPSTCSTTSPTSTTARRAGTGSSPPTWSVSPGASASTTSTATSPPRGSPPFAPTRPAASAASSASRPGSCSSPSTGTSRRTRSWPA